MTPHNARPIDDPRADDAFGEMVWDAFHDELAERPRYRRDDGDVTEAHLDAYFTTPESWRAGLHEALDRLDGPVLDVGCGPGKHARFLQKQGHDVLAIDRSPGAIAVAREWGVDHAAVMDIRDAAVLDSAFEGSIVLGKQIAVGDSPSDLRSTLSTLASVVEPGGRLVADFDAPERRGDGYLDDHWVEDGLAYRTFRVEYDDLVGPWVDVLMLELDTLEGIVSETPWEIDAVDRGDGSDYLVVFERGQAV
jgi:SAM-dependent methyltransferase